MESEEFILPDWSPPDNPIQSERASSSLMECEKFILPDWSPANDPARVLAAEGRRNPSIYNDRDLSSSSSQQRQPYPTTPLWQWQRPVSDISLHNIVHTHQQWNPTYKYCSVLGPSQTVPTSTTVNEILHIFQIQQCKNYFLKGV